MDGEVDTRRYQMLVGALRTVETNSNPIVVPAFFLKLLDHEGFRPHIESCVSCGSEGPLVSISLLAGGMLCQSCRQGRAGSETAHQLLSSILDGRLATVLAQPTSPATAEVAAIATEAVEHHIERRLRSPGTLV